MAGPGKDVWKYREQQHFIRDAIVRASHRVSVHLQGKFKKLDEKLAAAECRSQLFHSMLKRRQAARP